MKKKDTMKHEETMLTMVYDPQRIDDYSAPVPRYIDSDESDSDEVLPQGAFWPAPEEEEWTVVEISHGILHSARDIDSDRLYDSGDKLDRSGVRCKQLDYVDWNDDRYELNRLEPETLAAKVSMCHTINSCTRSEALPSNRKEGTQIDRSPTEDRLMTGPASTSVRPAVRKRPNVIVVEPRKTADRPVICPVNVVPTPQVEVHKSRCVGTCSGELFPEEPEVVPVEMAREASTEGPIQDPEEDRSYKKPICTTLTTDCVGLPKPTIQRSPDQTAEEASTGGAADNQPRSINQIYTRTTVTNLPTDYIEIGRPAPLWGPVELAEEASTDDTTNEQCIYEILDTNKTTDRKLSMELLEIPQQSLMRGFLELAEEARNICVKKKQCFLVEEVLPQVTEMTRPMIEPVSWATEEDLGQSVEVHREGAARVPTDKFEAGQRMQWPDIKSDGVMIDGIMLESEMSPVGSVRDVAEPVSVAAKSEVFTPVVFAGGRCCSSPPGRCRGSHSASFCPTGGWK